MRIFFLISVFIISLASLSKLYAQKNSFTGTIDYQTEITSKAKGISDESMKRLFAVGPLMKVYIKNGNYKREGSKVVQIHPKDSELVYIAFKGIDSLYTSTLSSEDSVSISIKKENKTIMIAGRPCQSIIIKRAKSISTYYYDPTLYQDPAFNKANDMGDYSLFLNETSSVYLKVITEYEYATLTETAFRINESKVDDAVFSIPSLPIAEMKPENFIKPAQFKNTQDWNNYLQKNINLDLVTKHVKIPKGQQSADQIAVVRFVVQSTGAVSEVEVINSKQVHSALVKEAIRLIQESYGWKPATVRGEKIDSWVEQKITFRSTIQ